MDKINVRQAFPSDAENIFIIDNEYEFEKYSLDSIKTTLKNDNYLNIIASVDGVYCGYLSAIIIEDECELLKVVVKKDYRKNGLGSELIDYLINYCLNKNVSSIFLEVREDNIPAKNLYLSKGFEKIGVREKYYTTIDGEIYRCDLNDKKN